MITASDIVKCRAILQTAIDCLYANRTIDQRAMAQTLEVAKSMISHSNSSSYSSSVALEVIVDDDDFYSGYDCDLCGGMKNPDVINHAAGCPNRDQRPSSQEPSAVSDFM